MSVTMKTFPRPIACQSAAPKGNPPWSPTLPLKALVMLPCSSLNWGHFIKFLNPSAVLKIKALKESTLNFSLWDVVSPFCSLMLTEEKVLAVKNVISFHYSDMTTPVTTFNFS